MNESTLKSQSENHGSERLNNMVKKLQSTPDKRKRYEYILWLGKSLPTLSNDLLHEGIKVKGCISQVYVFGKLIEGKIEWQGFSDALITRGLLAFLIKGLNDLTPKEIAMISPTLIEATGLQGSLTPSRANGFLNILLFMQAQAKSLSNNSCKAPTAS